MAVVDDVVVLLVELLMLVDEEVEVVDDRPKVHGDEVLEIPGYDEYVGIAPGLV